MECVTVLGIDRDEGSLVVFKGIDGSGSRLLFVADHGPAGGLSEALQAMEEPVLAEVESWQVIRRWGAPEAS